MDLYNGATVLVTGGAGSIGSAVVRELLNHAPYAVRVFDRDEHRSFLLPRKLPGRQLRLLLGDVTDRDRLFEAMQGVDVVFHCAALKHVNLCENNPQEATKVNVMGTRNVLDIAAQCNVHRLLFLSTDKVARPKSVMAETKALAEKHVTRFNRVHKHPEAIAVRLGNVMYSSGSLGEIIKDHVQRGAPWPLTSLEMRRFFISAEEAAKFIVRACAEGQGGEIWIPVMPKLHVVEMGQMMVQKWVSELGVDYDPNPGGPNYRLVGVKPGENIDEALWTEDEAATLDRRDGFYVIPPPL